MLQWQQMAIASEAVPAALEFFIHQDGGSRGARAICYESGSQVPAVRSGSLEKYHFRKQQAAHRAEQIVVCLKRMRRMSPSGKTPSFDDEAKDCFEGDWPAWLSGAIYASEAEQLNCADL